MMPLPKGGTPLRGSITGLAAKREVPGVKSNSAYEKRAMTTDEFAAAQQRAAEDYADSRPAGPATQLIQKIGQLEAASTQIRQQLADLHDRLGGRTPAGVTDDKSESPAPCGGQIGVLIDAAKRIEHNLDGCSDILGYLRSLTD